MALSGWSTSPSSNATVGSIDWAEGMAPAQVNNSARQMMTDFATWYRTTPEWIDRADSATYVSGTSFKFVGSNKSSIYSVGRRIKLVATTPGTIYGRITAVSTSASAGDTTVTVSWDSGSLSNEAITSVSPSIIKGGTSAQSIYIGGLKGISTFSVTTVGSTTAAAWRTALGLGTAATISVPVSVGNGGTGSTAAAAAFTALKQQATTTATGVAELATAAEMVTGTDTDRVPSVSVVKNHQGVAKAWVIFNGTNASISASYNVSGVVRNAAGTYTISFSTSFGSANYVVAGYCDASSSSEAMMICSPNTPSQAAGSIQITTRSDAGSVKDPNTRVCVVFYGDQ